MTKEKKNFLRGSRADVWTRSVAGALIAAGCAALASGLCATRADSALLPFSEIPRAGAASAATAPTAPADAGAVSATAEADALVAAALARNPELAAARSEASALGARAPAAGILSDPMLRVAYENDGGPISLGTEPMTRLIFEAEQSFPFPGKLGAARRVADADAARTAFRPERAALALAGAVRRAHADLLEARENERLADEQIETWRQVDETIRARYAAGMGTQQDVIRAQSERTRLLQQRRRDQAAEETALAELRRLLDLPPDAPVAGAARLLPGTPLEVPARDAAVAKAVEAAPEIRDAAALGERSRLAADLARRGTQPDFTVSAGYMNRGSLPLMWSAGVGVTVPVFAGARTRPLVAEARGLADSAASTESALKAIARSRAEERLVRMRQLADESRLDAEGVLPQDRLSVDAALASYRAGSVPFVTVLEALGTSFQDRRAAAGRLADFLRADADLREAALDRTASPPSSTDRSAPSSGGM
ncbi:MAG TPA: TolC family protein [Thermoanaerobaculia bacterium]|nr:TolC family protein [Thermoanaerobaculia bacterium]